MKWTKILIRYGELTTKGRNRKQFIESLRRNIKQTFSDLDTLKINAERDRMFLSANKEEEMEQLIKRLPSVFGIHSFSPVAICEPELGKIKEKAVEVMETLEYEGKSFKATVKRSDKSFPLETNELLQEIGGFVLSKFPEIHVQMKKPDIELIVEIRKEAAFIMAEVIPGPGGMPVGSNGKSLLMLSGGIDSPVAGYFMMKRGVKIDAIHFHSPPFTSERSKEKVMDLAERLSRFGSEVRLHVIPFTKIQQEIHRQVPENVSMTSTRRLMLQIADEVRDDIGAKAIVTGENLGQVASQTLESLTAINAVTSTPVLRPLITFDKLEIIDVAKKIDTYDISILPYEDCCTIFTPASPKTKPKLEKVEFYEGFTDFSEMISEAIQNREIITFPRKEEQSFEDLL
ncbi:tRNA uracil 4-sulfurtransferase ThiI [Chungangia koreensis]|uniref:Probable tRNA sulfurtransferase n=1 Tax=Chungangia koreensis TaxID=752657 RepID=A0ABV8X3R9_9LACT